MISQWCDSPFEHFLYRQYDINEKDPDAWTPLKVSKHDVCLRQRWHNQPDPDHVSPDEIESWYCQCPCHSTPEETPK